MTDGVFFGFQTSPTVQCEGMACRVLLGNQRLRLFRTSPQPGELTAQGGRNLGEDESTRLPAARSYSFSLRVDSCDPFCENDATFGLGVLGRHAEVNGQVPDRCTPPLIQYCISLQLPHRLSDCR